MAKQIEEMLKEELIELAAEIGLDLDPDALKPDILVAIQAATPPEPVPAVEVEEVAEAPRPKIKVRKHAAMCGQATVDNHEERLRDIEKAVAYLLAQ